MDVPLVHHVPLSCVVMLLYILMYVVSSCCYGQVRCNTDLTVVKRDKFWGEGDVVRDDFDHESPPQQVQPLGRLEFLLDPESDKLASQVRP